jgi:hypothetical protein
VIELIAAVTLQGAVLIWDHVQFTPGTAEVAERVRVSEFILMGMPLCESRLDQAQAKAPDGHYFREGRSLVTLKDHGGHYTAEAMDCYYYPPLGLGEAPLTTGESK